jgi:CheY-like chemotaxis protein
MRLVIRLDPIDNEISQVRILLIDDDPQIREVATTYLDAEGFRSVRTAPSGPDGVMVAEHFQPQIIFLDYMMPAMKGDDTAKLLRKVTPGAVLVAFSAILTERPEWADAFLPKSQLSSAAKLIEALSPISIEPQRTPQPDAP